MERIAVVNRTNFKNFGSVLQCYALCDTIMELGYMAEIIWEKGSISQNFDFRPKKLLAIILKAIRYPSVIKEIFLETKTTGEMITSDKSEKMFDSFVDEHLTQKKYSSFDLKKIANTDYYKKFVCGSDQIWSSEALYVDPLMYLQFCPSEKRIAYAPSIGSKRIPRYNASKMKKYINSIPTISVREKTAQVLISKLCGRKCQVVLDPTLLIKREKWLSLVSHEMKEQDYFLLYFLDLPDEKTIKTIISYLKNNNINNVICLGVKVNKLEKEVNVKYPDCGPKEFLYLINNAKRIITDSYHGILFSIIFRKEFIALQRKYIRYDQSSRLIDILRMLKIENRFMVNNRIIELEDIDYDTVDYILKLRS